MKTKTFATALALVIAVLASCQKESTFTGEDLLRDVKTETSAKKALLSSVTSQEPQIDTVCFSVIPCHKEKGIFMDGKDYQQAYNCMLIKYDSGYKVVIYQNTIFPSEEEILCSEFVPADMGQYVSSNSVYDATLSGTWLPALAEDYENGIRYTGATVRNIVNDTLDDWGWSNKTHDGKYSTRLDGYNVTVYDGYVQVSCGEATLILE